MCNNTLLGQRLNLSSSSDIFDNLIKKNEWETLIRLFSLNILDINHRDCKGRNILYFAILNKKYEYIKILFDLRVSSRVNFSLNAINFAVCLDDIKSLEILLKCGLSVDTLDEIGTSPLIYAILYNKKKSAEFLIKSGADLELEDFMGNCAKYLLHSK
ncbi:ankyrin repeat domain-containing protein [Aliarcobacter cryaerophilus]|uniref:ankyrin repeat domain-containing protein n=1 Tax=Aliarcobacter cryaerophilus TaxID=28198 RepID=UPI003DA4483E